MRPHTFHIPVMGTGFTVDTPLKVARYGISSAISMGDDKLLEKMRRYYCRMYREKFTAINGSDPDRRARRITEYLNLVDRLVRLQVERIRCENFVPGSDLTKYFELMSDASALKKQYLDMLNTPDENQKAACQQSLKMHVNAGSIDVNIMTKADRENVRDGQKLSKEYSDAMAALRGFAKSDLSSSVVLSAGLNLHLFSYISEFDDFYAGPGGEFKKKVILKVSDYRSAFVQAKIMAKKGVWVSEYRIESGLNCGGHAFPTTGNLMGPILEEFKQKRKELAISLYHIYNGALTEKKRPIVTRVPRVCITAQGGVGTAAEHELLLRAYEVDSVGWGSPFLLVPEATAVDDDTLKKLVAAREDDIYLSQASPLGVPFYNLKNSLSEEARRERIRAGKPGSPCVSKYLAFNTEYGEPLCVASFQYQRKKLLELKEKDLGHTDYMHECDKVMEKSCICHDLGDGALLKYQIDGDKKELTPAVCPGPNLTFFTKICSLKEMVDHIYGRINVIDPTVPRSHFLINELKLYIRYMKEKVSDAAHPLSPKETEYWDEFRRNLMHGIEYYRKVVERLQEESKQSKDCFLAELAALTDKMELIVT